MTNGQMTMTIRMTCTMIVPWQSRVLPLSFVLVFGIRFVIVIDADSYRAPLMPPSFRTRQKWTAIKSAAARGRATQCST